MLFCCCEALSRPYCFVVLIITLIFHIFEIFLLGQDFQKVKWIIVLLLCHMVVVCSTLASFKGVVLKEEKPLLIWLIFAIFGFLPIIIDMVLITSNEKIFTFDTSFIESTYGSNAAKPIIALILTLVLVVKSDLTVVVYQYCRELRRSNSAIAESTRL